MLIADEVGLGKTITAGLLLRQAWISGLAKRILLLVPKSFVVIAHETTLNGVLNPIIMLILLSRTLCAVHWRRSRLRSDLGLSTTN
jgi:hypothetical protein